ncbi:MAG: EboA domain-containing protein [Verrucomicrobiota bacterium]
MIDYLFTILRKTASTEACDWLAEVAQSQGEVFEKRPFYYAFSGVSRHFDKKALIDISAEENGELDLQVPGFSIRGWDEFRLARVILLLAIKELGREDFVSTIEAINNTADLREQTALFSAFPLVNYQEDLVEMAIDGLRSNIVDVFDSIALENPFASQHFSEAAWNQLILKAIFMGRPLHRVYGVDYRANLDLAEALSNYAHERWAAGRWVTPELWRSCANFLTDQVVEDIVRVAGTDEPGQLEAVALIVARDEDGRLSQLKDRTRTLLDDVADGRLTWKSLGQQL